jgi:hypothetical protein
VTWGAAVELMTQAEYARHRGVSRPAVNKAVRRGKIPVHVENGRKLIDPAEADRALGLNVQRVLADEDNIGQTRDAMRRPDAPGLTQARTATEVYRARLAELDYNERLGKLRPIEQTEVGARQCFEVVLRAFAGVIGRAEELNTRANKERVAGVRASLCAICAGTAAREFEKLPGR